jgi:tetratricopeptide (TPR) repeat protein
MLKLARNTLALGVLAAVAAVPAFAAPVVMRLHDGRTIEAHRIQSDAITGIVWMRTAQQQGTPNVRIWEVESLRYVGQEMDDFNSLPRRLAGGFGARVVQDADSYIAQEGTPLRGFTAAEWRSVQLSARYYRAHGLRVQGRMDDAIDAFRDFLTRAESQPVGTGGRVSYRSPISNRTVEHAAFLHRHYLDALENLGYLYLDKGDMESATTYAFTPLRELADALNVAAPAREYFDWPLRALRRVAEISEENEDWTAASQAYELVDRVAMRRDGGRASRESIQAELWMGYMNVRAGAPGAAAAFTPRINRWEQGHRRNLNQMRPPARGWISPDEAFAVAGSYVGQGLVEASNARDSQGWARSLRSYSIALSMFESGPEVRSLALLGAAKAASKLAERNAGESVVAHNYAILAEKYLNELTTLYGSTRPARDKSISEIQTAINNHKRQAQD